MQIFADRGKKEKAAPGGEETAGVMEQLEKEGKVLHIIDWAEWWPEEIYEGFSEEYGIKIVRDNFASVDDMVTKIKLNPGADYDITLPEIRGAVQMMELGLLQELNHDWLPNAEKYLPEATKNAEAEAGRLIAQAEQKGRQIIQEAKEKAAQTGRGGPDQAEVHFRLARLNESHLDDEDGAIAELRKAVELNPGHVGANDSLVEYCRKRGDNDGLWEALMRQEMNLETDSEKVAKLLEIADLQSGPLGDAAGAVASLERAHEMDKSNKDVMLKLSDGYIAAGREDEAIPVIESLIEAETLGGKRRSKGAAVYHQRLAKAYLSRGDQDKSLEHLESAYKMDISNTEVLISLGKLHYEREDWDKAIKLFRALLLQRFDSSAGVDKADIYWYVGDISLKQGDARKAKGMFQRGLDENNGHEGCKDGLSKC